MSGEQAGRSGRGRQRSRRPRWHEPRPELAPGEVDRGLRLLVRDGVATQVMGALTGGALLVGFALQLGASNKVIGLIAAVGPLSQILQIPAILLVEKIRRRKLLVVCASLVGRSFWLLVAALPWVAPAARIPLLVASLVLYFSSSSVASAAYNSWKRDLVPDPVMGRYFARRLTLATAAGAAVTLASGFAVDRGAQLMGGEAPAVFSPLFLLGAITGLFGVAYLGRIPEPAMQVQGGRSLRQVLAEPLADTNFRQLVLFLASWNFAVNLAAPFFTVYMLSRLGLSMAWVLGLSVMSQVANVLFFRIWGRLADRISNKSVLSLSGSLFIVSIALWPFTTLPERYLLTVPLLVAIHLLAGISTAGVNLCAGGITLKLAPRGKATAFLATNALASGAAATVAPALAGLLADAAADQRLSLDLTWSSPAAERALLRALDLQGLDFLFVIAVLCGLYALHRLLAVREEGGVDDPIVPELYGEMRRAVRHVSTAAGLRRLTSFPYALLRGSVGWRRRPPADTPPGPTPPGAPADGDD